MQNKIPQAFIDDVLNRVDIVDIIDSYVPLKKSGQNHTACCPFHSEKTPSFSVSQQKQFYHCFGCGVSGNVISFLMQYANMEFLDVMEKLAQTTGLEIPRTATEPIKKGVDLYQLMQQVNVFYQQQLRQHSEAHRAIEYLKQRGVSGEVAKKFGIGFAPRQQNSVYKNFGSSTKEITALNAAGLLGEQDQRYYDRFRDRIMFPIQDYRNRTIGFGGRVLDQKNAGAKYLNSPETNIFHKSSELYGLFLAKPAIKTHDKVIVVEGYMDVIALAQAGIENCVATLGTATTNQHLQRLFRYTSNICFCFDGDKAGKAAAWKALQTALPILNDGHQCSFLFLPDGEDPDSLVKKIGAKALIQQIDGAMSLPDFFINNLQKQTDTQRLDGTAKLAQLATPLLTMMSHSVLKTLIVDKLARVANVRSESFLTQTPAAPKTAQKNAPLVMNALRMALSLVLQHPNLARTIDIQALPNTQYIKGLSLFCEVVQLCQQTPNAHSAILLERYRSSAYFSTLEKLVSHNHHLKDNQLEGALNKLINQLQQDAIQQQLDVLLNKAHATSLDTEEKQQVTSLLQQQHALRAR